MRLDNFFVIFFLVFYILSITVKLLLDIINYFHRKKNLNKIPDELEGHVDEKKLELINKYTNEKQLFSLFEYFLGKILILILLFLKLYPMYYYFIYNYINNIYLITLLFFGGFLFLQAVINIPFSLYYNFVIEKKYQFNKMTFKLWIGDLIKSTIINIIIIGFILISLVFILYNFNNYWWFLLWLFFLVFSLVMQVIYPKFIAPLFNKFKPLNNEKLKEKIEKLMSDSGFKSEGVYEMDASKRSTHSNAYFTGIGKSKRIVLFDILLKNYSDEEILAVLAHEIGHFKYKHILFNIIISSIFTLFGFFISYLFLNNNDLYIGFYFNENIKIIGLFLLMIIGSPVTYFINPIFSNISRFFEYQADSYSKKMVGSYKPLASSLIKLNIDNLSNIFPADIYVWFYYSHPPLFKRIRALKES